MLRDGPALQALGAGAKDSPQSARQPRSHNRRSSMDQEMKGMQKHWSARMSQLDAEVRRELRSAYDVRVLLDELAEKVRSLASRQELGSVLQTLIEDALQPKSFGCYFEAGDFLLA